MDKREPNLKLRDIIRVDIIDQVAESLKVKMLMIEHEDLLEEIKKYRKALERIGGQAGIPDAGDTCRAIIKTVKEALGRK